VIGGGAIGVCCAHALAESGRSVLVLDQSRLGAGSSWGNAGLLTTSACAPLAAPGMLALAGRRMLERDSPVRFRPRFDRRLVRWLWCFRAQCTQAAVERGTAYLRERVLENTRLIKALAHESRHAFALRTNGLLVLFATEQAMEKESEIAEMRTGLGIPSQALDAARVAALEPTVGDTIIGGIHYPEDAHLDPGEFVAAVASLARLRGAQIAENQPVLRLHRSDGIAVIETREAFIRPELIVLAAGAWAPALARPLGIDLLVEPARGYSLTYHVGTRVYERPLRLHEKRIIVTSIGTSVRVSSKFDLVGMDAPVRERRARSSGPAASRYVVVPPGIERARLWAAHRPLTPDGLPLIGRHPKVRNLIVATGHGHLGMSLAALTGETVATLAAGNAPSFDLSPVDPERFD
jgi:D-amino-acid dehydrogenase